MSKDSLATEIPQSPRTPLQSVTMDDDLGENSTTMTKDHFNLLDSSAANDSFDNQAKESEYAQSIAEECEDEDVEQVRSPTKTHQTSHVRKRMVNNSNKKKPVRKRRVTANLSATKYDVGE